MERIEAIPSRRRRDDRTGAGAVRLREALGEAVRALGIEAKLLERRALMLLPELINELSGVTDAMARPAEIRRGELVIRIRQDAVRHSLMFERHRIQTRLNEALRREVVTSIRFGR